MPYPSYTKVTRDDVSAIRAYLRTLEPVCNEVRRTSCRSRSTSAAGTSAWNLINFQPGVFHPTPANPIAWNRGAYLVEGLGHCGTCHTPKNIIGGDQDERCLQGALLQGWFSPDLTGDPRTGIGGWSMDDIVRYLKTGGQLHDIASGPMADAVTNSTSHMTDADLLAIATYLKDALLAAERGSRRWPPATRACSPARRSTKTGAGHATFTVAPAFRPCSRGWRAHPWSNPLIPHP